ncbi:tRNA(Ile)-lysidine synthetase [Acetobacter malorum]|uniref:tRNA(Ile)-lysidine synthase n=1 Tax=Acetobacter malorum TaxID=178901 RepID=A0A177FWL4_9PROT|nr:tRNA lysidine(34) synthetase TilS [Acetobacter malorum]OAG71575.1 tRNA(Ile)-lysidine synthetase [Acetobacter malorum]
MTQFPGRAKGTEVKPCPALPDDPFSEAPLSPGAFVARIEQLGPWLPDDPTSPPVGLAVSGGGDSLCLAWLARHWRKNLLAFVVDHGLRAESAEEARLTVQRLTALGVPARLITLTTLTKGPGIAERARQARYAALAQACREAGCLDLLLGHQADDQVETIRMRQEAGSGPDGLAGMGWVTALPDVRLVRPLLGVSRQALRNTLRQAGLAWVDDPSNQDMRAERVRVRHSLQTQDTRHTLWQAGVAAGAARMQWEAERAAFLARQVTLRPEGWACLGPDLPEPEILSGLIRCVGGLVYPPPPAAVARLQAAGQEATLAGVQLVRGQNGWFLVREAAAMAGSVPAMAGARWDNRFELWFPPAVDGEGLRIGPAGLGLERKDRRGWPALFCATLPALWRGDYRVAVPHLGWWAEEGLKQARFLFQPPVSVTGSGVYGWPEARAEQHHT